MKYTLKVPVKNGSETLTEMTIREEVVAGDLRGIKAAALADPSIDDILLLASRLCAQPVHVMNALSMPDFDEVGAAVLGFFKRGQETGTPPSP